MGGPIFFCIFATMINSLQSLRGIFAIMIFLSHFVLGPGDLRAFYEGGTMGVEFFIVLSGFVMCAGYERKVEAHNISYRDFMTRRLIRIYPLHLLCLAAWMVLTYGSGRYQLDVIGVNALLLQAWLPGQRIFYGCNTPSWCLSVFLFLYAVFPFIIDAYHRNARRFSAAFGVFVLVFLVYLALLPDSLDENYDLWLTRISPPVRLIDFVIGMMLWQAYTMLKGGTFIQKLRKQGYAVKTIIELVPLLIYIPCAMASEVLPSKWSTAVVWWLPTILCVMTYALMDGKGGALTSLFDSKWLVKFGNASFCFYLMHILVVKAVYRFCNHFDCVQQPIVMMFITLAVAVIASMAVSRWIDAPVGRYLRKKFL